MFTRILAAAVFALLTVAAPARAAYVDSWDGVVNLTYSFGQIAGSIDLTTPAICCHGFFRNNAYALATDLTLNGSPLTPTHIGNISGGPGTEQDYFVSSPPPFFGPFPFTIVVSNLPNLSYLDFVGATGGTVEVLSYTCSGGSCPSAVPLPAALPLFGTALAGLGGAGWLKRRKVSVKA